MVPKRILLATDGSDNAAAAAQLLGALPLAPGTEVQVLCVVDPFIESLLEGARKGEIHHGRHVVRAAEKALQQEGLKVHGDLRTGAADHQILLAAQEFHADLIVLGSRGLTGLEGFVLGSVARNVAKHAHCSVLVARVPRYGLSSAILATDGSAHAAHALELAAELPLPAEASITVVNVLRPQNAALDMMGLGDAAIYEALREAEKEARAAAQKLVDTARGSLERRGKRATAELRDGDPACEILAAVDERNADLVIAGARGASLIEGLLTGSVADRLLYKAQCSVLVVR